MATRSMASATMARVPAPRVAEVAQPGDAAHCDHILDGGGKAQVDIGMLLDVGDADVAVRRAPVYLHRAGGGPVGAGNNLEQGALAGAVGAHHRDPLARGQVHRNTLESTTPGVVCVYVTEFEHHRAGGVGGLTAAFGPARDPRPEVPAYRGLA